MKTSTKAYVPASLTRTRPVLIPCPVASMRAPPRFCPRSITRTGLIVWPAHQSGGSTFDTEGACAAQTATEQHAKTSERRRRAVDVLTALIIAIRYEGNRVS